MQINATLTELEDTRSPVGHIVEAALALGTALEELRRTDSDTDLDALLRGAQASIEAAREKAAV